VVFNTIDDAVAVGNAHDKALLSNDPDNWAAYEALQERLRWRPRTAPGKSGAEGI
jgi:hypothetical protein